MNVLPALDTAPDPVTTFLEAASVPTHGWHAAGTLEEAEVIRNRHPEVARANIYTAAVLGIEETVRSLLAQDSTLATKPGGPHGWDALTYLCFSRYLRLVPARSEGFVRTAEALLDAGADANTGWHSTDPQPTFEAVLYGAAGLAEHPGLTRLLLERGADPNDDETSYHVPESYDNTVARILLESGKFNANSLAIMLVRKADIHDLDGLRLVLAHGADPNIIPVFDYSGLQQALRRDNCIEAVALLLDHGGDPSLPNGRDGRSVTVVAAHRGRANVLRLLEQRGIPLGLTGVDRLIAACALADRVGIASLTTAEPQLVDELLSQGGNRLAEFAGNNNLAGIGCLLDLGVPVDAPYAEGDPYFEIPKDSTALHVAAWRARHAAVKLLIERGAAVNMLDARGRSALALAVKACVDSHWKGRRSSESVSALLDAGASVAGIEIPCGYDEVDALLRQGRG